MTIGLGNADRRVRPKHLATNATRTRRRPMARRKMARRKMARSKRLQRALAIGLALLATVSIGRAADEAYPSRPITVVVPYPAGGLFDAVARILAEPMRLALGQSVVIENVGGAGGSIAAGRVARAAPDGYTVGIGSGDQLVVNAAIYPLQYDVVKDFDPVALLMSGPAWILTKPTVPASDLKELVAWLKANHDKISQGHNGAGGALHLCGLELQRIAGASWPFVPYRGAAPALQDVLGGRIDLICPSPASSIAMVRGAAARLCRHRPHPPRLRAGGPRGGRGRLPGPPHFGLGRTVRPERNAQARDRETCVRRHRRAGRSGGAPAAREARAGCRAAREADRRGAGRAAEGRDRKVVADHQGGERQGRMTRTSPVTNAIASTQRTPARDARGVP